MNLKLSKTQLQLIAIFAMTLDHIAWAFAPGYSYVWWALIFHAAGRITAPIMWFFIAQGYEHTKNIKKYALRLLVFAVISHFAYNFFTGNSFIPFRTSLFNQTSVIWGLFLGLVGIIIIEKKEFKIWQKALLFAGVCILSFFADWSFISPLAVAWIYINRGKKRRQLAGIEFLAAAFGLATLILADPIYGALQSLVCLSFHFIYFYSGEKGKMPGSRYFFYIYYPAHLVILGILKLLF